MPARSDREWEKYGSQDPYYGVLSDAQYSKGNLGKAEKEKFFRTGKDHIDHVIDSATAFFGPPDTRRALDFGCGVGRLVIPLSARFEEVVGLDVSSSMLEEARLNCGERELGNVSLKVSDGRFEEFRNRISFLHSFIVFQHILPEQGMRLFGALVDSLDAGGIGAVHFCYAIRVPPGVAFKRKVVRTLPWLHLLVNIVKRRPLRYPMMEMNEYDCNGILSLLQAKGITRVVCEYTDHADHWGVMVYFRKASLTSAPPSGYT